MLRGAPGWQLIRPAFSNPPTIWSTPNGSSWVNRVERFFADIAEKQIRRGVHRSTAELETAIRAYLDAGNADPKPFRWTKSANDILAAIKRLCPQDPRNRLGPTEIAPTSASGH